MCDVDGAGGEGGAVAAASDAVASTEAQRARVARIVESANRMLSAGGEGALQMKDLAARAGVSLATLYRYFPSKDLLLVALGRSRYEAAVAQVAAETPAASGTPGERAASLLLREFRVALREPSVAAALTRVGIEGAPELREPLAAIQDLHEQMVLIAAQSGGAVLSGDARRLIPLLIATFGAGSRAWLAGTKTSDEVRLDIAVACRLLDLPEEHIAAVVSAGRGLAAD